MTRRRTLLRRKPQSLNLLDDAGLTGLADAHSKQDGGGAPLWPSTFYIHSPAPRAPLPRPYLARLGRIDSSEASLKAHPERARMRRAWIAS
jgi:hypothetical protein